MYHMYCNCEIKNVLLVYTIIIVPVNLKTITHSQGKSLISIISMTSRRKNLPEESIKKEHITGLQ